MKKWTEYEINFLKDNYHKTSCKYCADQLKLPENIVYSKICRLKLTKPKKWSLEQINFLKDNYYKTSCKYCADILNLSEDVVYGKIRRLKLTKECKYNLDSFKNIQSKNISYLLGFIWADGYVRRDSINLDILKKDGDEIRPIFDEIGYYCLNHTKSRKKNKEKIGFRLCSIELTDIFKSYDYYNKSILSPKKVLNKIPDNLKFYFYRGIIDGDGNFYFNKKNYIRQFTLSSSFNQDWTYMIDLCNLLNISKYRVDRIIHISKKTKKENKSSQFRICRKSDINILGEYIYQNYDSMGLERKYNKYKEICQ